MRFKYGCRCYSCLVVLIVKGGTLCIGVCYICYTAVGKSAG